MKEKNFNPPTQNFSNRENLKMRGLNLKFEFKFEICIKFRVEWYIMMIGFVCS